MTTRQADLRDERAVVLVGPMGAGKSRVGRRVARTLDVAFADTDAMIARAHGPISEIFSAHGEERFRVWEREAVTRALADGGVVALGGGAVLDRDTRADLSRHRVVLLTVDARRVRSRLGGRRRPLLEGDVDEAAKGQDDAVARWVTITAERREYYEDVADVTFDTSTGPLSGIVDAITNWVKEGQA